MVTAIDESKVSFAISDSNRRRLMDLLLEREISVKELSSHFDISMAAISQHLKILHESGLVQKRPEGPRRYYRARPESLHAVHEWTSRYEKFWKRRLRKIGEYLNSKK
jgi:DNA-binding transcriptional ArsR family regulator